MKRILYTLTAVCLLMAATGCQDEVSDIGSSLVSGEVAIAVDTITADLDGTAEWLDNIDSRATNKLLGRLTVPEYGSLSCSFVAQMMCSTNLLIPDSIKRDDVDSIKMHLFVLRGNLTGDSLAPQQLKLYRLTQQLPTDISSDFNPQGYYDPAKPYGVRSYTISNIAKGDSAYKKDSYVDIDVKLPKEFAVEIFDKYRAGDPIFAWPQTFAQWFPGIYVEQNFGNGCVANVSMVQSYIYWHRMGRVSYTTEDGKVSYKNGPVRDSLCILASQPEVLSSNNIVYKPSAQLKQRIADGDAIITSPGGYMLSIKFPLKSLVERYLKAGTELSVVTDLSMMIPAHAVKNDYGLEVAPYLLMVRKKDREAFFRDNKIPDNTDSFYAKYDSENACYSFKNMRPYFLKVLEEVKKGNIQGEDEEFVLVPVAVTTEDVQGYSSVTTYVTRVAPYLSAPSMTLLDTDKAQIYFTFSSQTIE